MKLPIDRNFARNLVAQTFPEAVIDPISGALSDSEKLLIQNLAVSLLSEGPHEPVSPPRFTRWVISTYSEELLKLPPELKELFPSSDEVYVTEGRSLLERYLEALIIEKQNGKSEITHYGEVVNELEANRAHDVVAETVRLFSTAYQRLPESVK